LVFNWYLKRVDLELDLNVNTENWEKILGAQFAYLGVKFGAIATVEIPRVKGDVLGQAKLTVDERGRMYLFFIRLVRVRKPNSREDHATVRECHVISKENNPAQFEKRFASLAANNSDFGLNIVRGGLDPVYLKLGEKEREFKTLMKFKEIWERAVCR
ncbi:MAG: hypothetical protein PHE24_06425, partial [Patescibacteria group bacterium]|nr:hypothetical protein [Patescibacteria group bacterium]